jgi:hypothetical protein
MLRIVPLAMSVPPWSGTVTARLSAFLKTT